MPNASPDRCNVPTCRCNTRNADLTHSVSTVTTAATDLINSPFTAYNPGELTMPYVSQVYCYECDDRFPERDMHACASCGDYLCVTCAADHVHNGGFCTECGFSQRHAESTATCRQCGDQYCGSHARQHRACGMGPYDVGDDGQYTGRPPTDGWGREATLQYIDIPYIHDDRAVGKRSAAIEVEAEYKWSNAPKGRERMYLPTSCGVAGDGSLSNGVEVTTPPAKGQILAATITEVMGTLIEHGYDKDHSCGMHAHIDLRDHKGNYKFMAHLFNAFYAIEDILFAMQVEDRYDSTFSIPMRNSYKFFDMYGQKSGDFDYTYYRQPKTIDGQYEMSREKERKYAGNRYMAFNFHSVFFRGSLECRLHEGSVDATDALLWIDLLQAIIARVEKGHSYTAMRSLARQHVTEEKVKQFFRYFKLSPVLRAFVNRRITDGQGYGFELPEPVSWGVPIKGRPASHEPAVRRRMRYVGSRIRCSSCSHEWTLRASNVECPQCWERLLNRYGERRYIRVERPLPSATLNARRRNLTFTTELDIMQRALSSFDITTAPIEE